MSEFAKMDVWDFSAEIWCLLQCRIGNDLFQLNVFLSQACQWRVTMWLARKAAASQLDAHTARNTGMFFFHCSACVTLGSWDTSCFVAECLSGAVTDSHRSLAHSPVTSCQQSQREEVVPERRLELLSADGHQGELWRLFSGHQWRQNQDFPRDPKEPAARRRCLVLVRGGTTTVSCARGGHAPDNHGLVPLEIEARLAYFSSFSLYTERFIMYFKQNWFVLGPEAMRFG